MALAATVGIPRRIISNHRAACIGNLYQLGLLLKLYARDHGGSYPSEWMSIADTMDESDLRLFLPSQNHSSLGERTTIDSWAHYKLIPGRSVSDPPDTILAVGACKKGGGCVLFVDGRTEWQDPARFRPYFGESESERGERGERFERGQSLSLENDP